eukprot:c5427_g1_i2.p2 GENE.c5427_g1_i2~~c5427_g1_i2.p2  ORF type:complete len:279 (+),score=57.97 c5427_g1_i2:169-1005(+)
MDTPITEMGFAGIGVGAAMAGLRPIVEFMTWNFSLQAIDHVVNSAAKTCYMSGGTVHVPIVFRGPNGAAAGVAAQHSQCLASWYASVPGLKVVAPYDADDARGLLKAAVRDNNPVVILENEILYGMSFPVTPEVLSKDYLVPFGKAKVMRAGQHVSLVSFGKGVLHAMEAAALLEKDGVSAEVINLRSLRPMDRQAIIDSVKKTSRLVTVEEGWPESGIGSEILSIVCESDAFDYLDAPPERVTGLAIPTPYATKLESLSFPRAHNVVNAVRRVMARK